MGTTYYSGSLEGGFVKRQQIAYHLSKFTKIFNQFMIVVLVGLIAFLAIQLWQNNKLLLTISQDNKEKLDQALPVVYPLKFTPQQNVLREPPLFHLDNQVEVEAVFINDTKEDVTFGAAVHWVLVYPLETGVEDADTNLIMPGIKETITPGCRRIVFLNQAPGKVRTITQKFFDAGYQKVTWRLTGDNVIISPEGGGSAVFNVDEFSYIPKDISLPKHRDEHIKSIACGES